MKIMWSVNTVPPEISKSLGIGSGHAVSWVDAMSKALSKKNGIDLSIVAKGNHKCRTLKKECINGITYYVLPFSLFSYKHYWRQVIEDFNPDIVQIYGTEKKHNLDLIQTYGKKIPMLISLQGIVSEYLKYYYAGLSKCEILFNYTFNDFLFRNGIFEGKRRFARQSKYEIKMLRGVDYVEGRSDWDYAFSKKYNTNLEYFYCPRMIRQPFFNYSWHFENMEKKSLFVHQGNYPIKGLHILLDALFILKQEFADIKLYVSGDDIFDSNNHCGYTKIIRKRINKLGLRSFVHFTGFLNADQLAKKLSTVNICVIPSAIENAPNSLAEAMLIGTPCVVSCVGGNSDMLNNGKCGLLYPYDEPEMLASKIKKLLISTDLQNAFSAESVKVSKNRHDPNFLPDRLLNIYKNIIMKTSGDDKKCT